MVRPLTIRIEMNEDLVTPRTHARIMKEVHKKAGEIHKTTTIKKHFENVPESRPGGAYGYEARGRRYAFRKQRTVGHRRPNVYSGKMRAAVLSTSIVRANQHRWTFTARNYFKMRAAQRDELEAVSRGEIGEITRRMRAYYVTLANRPENRRKRRRKTKR